MNVEAVISLVDRILDIEKKENIQHRLNDVLSHLQQLANSPAQASFQSEFAARLQALQNAEDSVQKLLLVADIKEISGLGGEQFFLQSSARVLRTLLASNPVTPTVAVSEFQTFIGERDAYLRHLRGISENLKALGFRPMSLTDGTKLSISIPPSLTGNELGKLATEIENLDRIIQFISQAVIGEGVEIQIESISTSIPKFIVNLAVPVALAFAGAVSWGLDSWKSYEQANLAREQARAAGLHSDIEIAEFFDERVRKQQDARIRDEALRIMSESRLSSSRPEQEQRLIWALDSLLGRLQRGLEVEVFLPPPSPHEEPELQTLRDLSTFLRYGPITQEVLRQLPAPPPKPETTGDQKKD